MPIVNRLCLKMAASRKMFGAPTGILYHSKSHTNRLSIFDLGKITHQWRSSILQFRPGWRKSRNSCWVVYERLDAHS